MTIFTNEPRFEKTGFRGLSTRSENDKRLEISDLESREIVLFSENKGANQLHDYKGAVVAKLICAFVYPVFS